MTDSGRNGKKGKGFAGLETMVSDISEDVEKAAQTVSPKAAAPEPPPSEPSPQPQPARPEPRPAPGKSSPPSGSGRPGLGWVIAGVIILVIWIANSGSGNKSPSTSHPSPNPSAPAVSISDDEQPPIGHNNILSIPQIRWCKREKIRIDAIESVINNAYDYEVNRFNARVSDYNSRCGEFRYRRGNVEQVDRELASERYSIAAAAKSEWGRGSFSGYNSQPTPSYSTPPSYNSQPAQSYSPPPSYSPPVTSTPPAPATAAAESKSEWGRSSLELSDTPPAPHPKNKKHPISNKEKPVAGPSCQSDGQCPDGKFCVRGHCGRKIETKGACKRSTDCAGFSSRCVHGQCRKYGG